MIDNGTWQARTHPGLEQILEQELKNAGAEYLFVSEGVIKFKADEKTLYNFLIHTFVCTSVEVLLSGPVSIKEADVSTLLGLVIWPDVIPIESVFSVKVLHNGTTNGSLRELAGELEKGIQEIFLKTFSQVPKIEDEEHHAEFSIVLHIETNGSCYLALEAGGSPFGKRGSINKSEGGVITPALAAGLILLSGWNKNDTFLDPFAGSGTILIEAARIAKNRTPSFDDDNFLMRKWRTFRHALWKKSREELLPEIRKDVNWIFGSDYRKFIFSRMQHQIKQLRLNENIKTRFSKPDDIFYPQGPALILTAPAPDTDTKLVEEFVRNTKKYAHSYRLAIFTPIHNLDSIVNMKPESVTKITLEDREFSFMQFDIFNPKKRMDDRPKNRSGSSKFDRNKKRN